MTYCFDSAQQWRRVVTDGLATRRR